MPYHPPFLPNPSPWGPEWIKPFDPSDYEIKPVDINDLTLLAERFKKFKLIYKMFEDLTIEELEKLDLEKVKEFIRGEVGG